MPGRHVRDLVRHRRRHFVLFVGNLEQRRVDEDISARQRKRVRRIAFNHLKRERHFCIGVANQILADPVDVFRDQRVVHHLGLPLDFLRQLLAQRHLFFQRVEIHALADIPVADLGRVVLLVPARILGEPHTGRHTQQADQRARKSHRLLLKAIINVL